LQNCILSDESGLPIPCNICTEPGAVVVRPASSFQFRPVPSPIGVDLFDPLPLPLTVDALNFLGGVAIGYNGTADIRIPVPECQSTVVPNTMPFTTGIGSGLYEVQCCTDNLLPDITFTNTFDLSDPGFGINGVSNPWLGVAKGDLNADNSVNVLDVTRTVRLSLNLAVGIPPPFSFQTWAGDMLDPACTADGTNNVLDVIRVENKALNLPALCTCNGSPIRNPITSAEALAAARPISLRLEKGGKKDFLVVVEDAANLGGFQLDLRGAGPRATAALEGLTAGKNWQVASNFDKGVFRIIVYSADATGVSGDGAVLRISGAANPRMMGIIASDSRGREIPIR
jgi:hypothetical protein